jgi:hypothetical protein
LLWLEAVMNVYMCLWKLRAQEINALLRDAISNEYVEFFFHVILFLSVRP